MPEVRAVPSRSAVLIPIAIFVLALAVRLVFVWQAADSPFWRVPLIDDRTNDIAAKTLNSVGWLAPLPEPGNPFTPYFQPPFYQFFLAAVYRVLGPWPISAALLQYLIGSACCVLTYLLGRRLFSRQVGITAGISSALTAPLIYYEGRLLPPVLLILMGMAVLLLALKQTDSPAFWRWPAIGLITGLSAVTRPDTLLFVPPLLFWVWMERKTVLRNVPALSVACLLLGILLPTGLVAARNQVVGRDSVPISANGGINFYLGNHPDLNSSLGIRPGIAWSTLMKKADVATGTARPSDTDRYFYRESVRLMAHDKTATVSNLARKMIWVWHGPEIRRNESEYYLTRVSGLYRMLLWRVGPFGFPFGIIGPFALLGIVTGWRRRELFLPCAYVGTQVLAMVAYFPCSRYRVPILPLLLILGSAAAFGLFTLVRKRSFRPAAAQLGLLLVFGVLTTCCPPGFEGTPAQKEADNLWMLGVANYFEQRPDESLEALNQGLELDSDNVDLHNWLAIVHISRQEYADAEVHAEECVRLAPDYWPAYRMLADIYTASGKSAQAAEISAVIRSNRHRWEVGGRTLEY